MNRFRIPARWLSSTWAVLLLFFSISVAAFGLLLPKLGYYMDDWHFVYYAHTFGVQSLKELLLYDSRPYAAGLYILGFRILGFKPLAWHLSVLILRTLTAFVFYKFFEHLWQHKKKVAFVIAILFLIYPYFSLQPMAVAYFIHWVGFLLYAVSLYLMLLAFKRRGLSRFTLVGLAVLLESIHLFSSEYFAGLELLRVLFIWIMISQYETRLYEKLKKTLFTWLPYLFVFGVYAVWRGVIFVGPVERNTPVLLHELFESPIATLVSVLVLAIKDAIAILFVGWSKVLVPKVFDFSALFSTAVLFVMVAMAVVLSRVFAHFLAQESQTKSKAKSHWRREALLLGIAALSLGELPIWLVGNAISTHNNQMAATRFGLASMLGAAILFAIVIDYLINNVKKEGIVLALAVSLAVGAHLHNAHEFERSWEKQRNLYEQLTTRIPALAPNTTFVSLGEILFFMGEDPTANVINTIYSSGENPPSEAPYWFASIYASYAHRWSAFLDGIQLEERHLSSGFSGNSHDILLISYEPEQGQCLWVLRPKDMSARSLSDFESEASLLSSTDRIYADQERDPLLPPDIFGANMPNNWCSYYQRADLARQRGEWQEITRLWEEAQANQKSPANGFEYIPFIEGYAHTQQWTQVKKLTRQSNKVSQGMYHVLCPTLDNIELTTSISDERDAILTDIRDYLKCE